MKGAYENDREQGPWTVYYESGKVKMNVNYNNGLLEGIQRGYSEEGNLIEKAEYFEGQLVRRIK